MSTIDWHNERPALATISLLDVAPESAGINLAAVRRYRLNRVRKEMKSRNIAALIMSDPVSIR